MCIYAEHVLRSACSTPDAFASSQGVYDYAAETGILQDGEILGVREHGRHPL